MAVTNQSFIKWLVPGGWSIGKVLAVQADKVTVELPNSFVAEKALADVHEITENQYQKALRELVDSLNKQYPEKDVDMADKNKEQETKAQTELDQMKAENEQLTAQIKTLTETATKVNAVEEVSKKELEKVRAQLATIEKERKSEARFHELKVLGGIEAIAESEKDAKSVLGDMSDIVYAATLNMAQSFKKLTDKTLSDKIKLTQKTETDLTKLTEASEEEKEIATARAEEEKDTQLANAANTSSAPSAFTSAMSKLVNKKPVQSK